MKRYTILLSIHTKNEILYIIILEPFGTKQKMVRSGRDVPDGTWIPSKSNEKLTGLIDFDQSNDN